MWASVTIPGEAQRFGNHFAARLEARGLVVGRNAAVDLGVSYPPVVIEAKIVKRWADAVRATVGQLYEYRFFKVANPKSALIFLASIPVPPEWVKYLETDRKIGVAWASDSGETPRV